MYFVNPALRSPIFTKYLETLHLTFTLQKVQFSHPMLWGNNILHKFYRIAAYDKQIRCLAYAQDLTG